MCCNINNISTKMYCFFTPVLMQQGYGAKFNAFCVEIGCGRLVDVIVLARQMVLYD